MPCYVEELHYQEIHNDSLTSVWGMNLTLYTHEKFMKALLLNIFTFLLLFSQYGPSVKILISCSVEIAVN